MPLYMCTLALQRSGVLKGQSIWNCMTLLSQAVWFLINPWKWFPPSQYGLYLLQLLWYTFLLPFNSILNFDEKLPYTAQPGSGSADHLLSILPFPTLLSHPSLPTISTGVYDALSWCISWPGQPLALLLPVVMNQDCISRRDETYHW